MPDDAVETNPAPTEVYQVVGYEDVRGVAVDAATTAVESLDARTDAELQSVADDAASKALDDVSVRLDDTVASIQQVADKAVADIDSRAESLESVQVELSDEQWAYLHDSIQVQSTCAVLSLLMVCACFGAIVVRYFVEGWRR